MRSVLFIALCSAGCLISAPEGAPQTWPPVLGLEIEAVTSGDLDGNGSLDVVVYSSGTSSQRGMYLLANDKDIVDGGVRSFSTYVPAEINQPVAAFQTTGAAPSVYVATGTDRLELVQYARRRHHLRAGIAHRHRDQARHRGRSCAGAHGDDRTANEPARVR